MTNSSDSAEQLVRIYLEGVEVALKISGQATKHIIASLYAISKDKTRTKGKIRLGSMLKTGKEVKIFSINKEDLRKFSHQAKKYGVLYCALVGKLENSKDGIVDIMVRAEDAPKINRIVERFNFNTTIGSAEIKEEIEKGKQNSLQEEVGNVEKSPEELLVEDLLRKPEPEKTQEKVEASLSSDKSEKESQLGNYSEDNNIVENLLAKNEKPSVREELKEIKKDMEREKALELALAEKQEKTIPKEIKHKQVKKKAKKKKYLEKGKHFNTAKHLKSKGRSRE